MKMHNRRYFIMTTNFNFTCTILCMLILRQWKRSASSLLQNIVATYKKMSTLIPFPKHWLGFSYIRLEDYYLDVNFDEIELRNNHTSHPTIKLKYFAKVLWYLRKNVWWYEFNWWWNLSNSFDQTCKNYIHSKINFPHDKKRRIREIAIDNGWDMHIA